MMTAFDGVSCLYAAAKNGYRAVVDVLVACGGRELLMLTADDGASCLYAAAEEGHLELVEALLHAGGRELLAKSTHAGSICLDISLANDFNAVARLLANFEISTREL